MAACCRTPRLTTDGFAWIGSRHCYPFWRGACSRLLGPGPGPGLIDTLSIAVCGLVGLVYRDDEMHLACAQSLSGLD